MKKVLFISVTNLNLKSNVPLRLKKKFEGLSKGIKPYVLAKGRPLHKEKWGADFFLLPPNFLFWPCAFFLAFYLCLTKKIDAIVCQSPLVEGFTGSILKKLLKKELIVEIHGDWIEGPFLSKKRKLAFLERKIVPILAKISFRNADKIRAVAGCLAEKAKKIAPKKPYFIFPTFTDLSIFLYEKETKFDNFILFVGHLEKVKGANTLMEAFHKLNFQFSISLDPASQRGTPRRVAFQLLIIGEGSERKNLELQVASYKLQDKVEFKGKLSLEETKDIMKNCYCLVLPSLSEGLPRVIMEAMALGKPLIASNVGGIPELIKDNENGFLFRIGDSQELAEKLRVLLRDKKMAQEMGQKGREFVKENFSNEKYLQNYIQMINS